MTPPDRKWSILVSDEKRLPDPLLCLARMPPQATLLARHYADPCREAAIGRWARAAKVRRIELLVAGDWRLAARVGADGLHLPEHLARRGVLAPAMGWVRRRGLMLTVACHSRSALARARRLGADAAILSPVFPTSSHPGAPTIGAARWRLWARAAGLPVVAMGGVDARTVRPLVQAAGFAALGGWL